MAYEKHFANQFFLYALYRLYCLVQMKTMNLYKTIKK